MEHHHRNHCDLQAESIMVLGELFLAGAMQGQQESLSPADRPPIGFYCCQNDDRVAPVEPNGVV